MATLPDQSLPSDTLLATPGVRQVIAATPWSRYWARTVDFCLWLIPAEIILYLVLPASVWNFLQRDEARFFDHFASVPIVLLLDALCMARFGQTPGKALLGIRLTNSDGTRLNFAKAIRRDLSLFVRGLGLGIPLFSLFTLIWSFMKVNGGDQTSWDRKYLTTVISDGACFERTAIVAFLVFCLMAIFIFLEIYQTGLYR